MVGTTNGVCISDGGAPLALFLEDICSVESRSVENLEEMKIPYTILKVLFIMNLYCTRVFHLHGLITRVACVSASQLLKNSRNV